MSSSVTQLERALRALRALRQRVQQLESSLPEAIAVVGMGCRFPGGANNPQLFWELLQRGGDAIVDPPEERTAWRETPPGVPRRAGFLAEVKGFDAGFFGIAPREAERMDPQQRLLLEVAWEALEDAGQDLANLRGTRGGVFVGMSSGSSDYYHSQIADATDIDTYTGTGGGHDVAAGRIAYLLDFRGPSMVLDTACSSSLVAVHTACQSLRSGDCQLALAGGVNLFLSPTTSIVYSRLSMLAPDGRCKTFDARADGFARGEGCGVIVLKRLSDAERDGDRILALIRGSAINQDGHTNGLTAPNGLAQQDVVRRALAQAGLPGAAISYVEAHGTGTALGDPIEVESLAAVLGENRPAGEVTALRLGAVKSNLGHLEAAAGIAGLIKTILCLRNEQLPPLCKLESANPLLPLDSGVLRLVRHLEAWPRHAGEARRAGVSSFGWSGTNAHVIVEEAPEPVIEGEPEAFAQASLLLPLSAQSVPSLHQLAGAYANLLEAALQEAPQKGVQEAARVCRAAARHRTHYAERLAVHADSPANLLASLREWQSIGHIIEGSTGQLAGEARGIFRGKRAGGATPVTFVFSGQGGQWWGMGQELMASSPVFRAMIERCAEAMRPYCDWDLVAEMSAPEERSRISRGDIAQPAQFALQVGLAAVWKDWGIVPSVVIGHSLGEVAAAYVAGGLSLEDAARLVLLRGRLMEAEAGKGRMLSVALSPQEAEAWIAPYAGQISIAVYASPSQVVLSGNSDTLEQLLPLLVGKGISCQFLMVNHASHCQQMQTCATNLRAALAFLRPQQPRCRMISSSRVPGSSEPADLWVRDGAEFGPSYWFDNVLNPVRFAPAMEALVSDKQRVFLELSPHPILHSPMLKVAEAMGVPVQVFGSLNRKCPEEQSLLQASAGLYAAGCDIAWSRVYPRPAPVDLPLYPWKRECHWWEPASRKESARATSVAANSYSDWFYESDWELAPLTDSRSLQRHLSSQAAAVDPRPAAPHWMLFLRPDTFGRELLQAFVERNLSCTVVLPACQKGSWQGSQPEGVDFTVAPPEPWNLGPWIQKEVQSRGPCHLLSAWGPFSGSDADGAPVQLALALAQALHALPADLPGRLFLLSEDGSNCGGRVPLAGQSALWGFARALAVEIPARWGAIVDYSAGEDPGVSARAVVASLLNVEPQGDAARETEDQCAIRAGERFALRLQALPPIPQGQDSRPSWRCRPGAAYLVTGGFGKVGSRVLRWLAAQGAEELIIVSRQGLGADDAGHNGSSLHRRELVRELESQGVMVEVIAADVTEMANWAEVWPRLLRRPRSLRGIFHIASDMHFDSLGQLTADKLQLALQARSVFPRFVLQRKGDLQLDHLLLFSSIGAYTGAASSASYCCANRLTDGLALELRAAGLPAQAISWGIWEEVGGMPEELQQAARRSGLRPMPAPAALAALGCALMQSPAHCIIADVDWERMKPVIQSVSSTAFLARVGGENDRTPLRSHQAGGVVTSQAAGHAISLQDIVAQATTRRDAAALLRETLAAEVARLLGFPAGAGIDPDAGFFSLGMDSLTAVQLRTALQKRSGLVLPRTLTFNYPDVSSLSLFLLEKLSPALPDLSSAGNEDDLAEISDEEARRLLAEELSGLPQEFLQ